MIDTLRADHLSHFGYHRDTAAALDSFAAQATVFQRCQAPSSWTNPSMASLFTGLFTARHRTNQFGATLSEELITLAELVQHHGWHTAAICFNPGVRSELNFDQGFETFDEYLGKATDYPDIDEMVSRLSTWLGANPRRPFFLHLHPMNVHGPYRVPKQNRSVLLGQPPGREFRYYGKTMQSIMRKKELQLRETIEDAYLQSLIDQYDTAVRYSTDKVAEILAILRDYGLYDNSLIIITADHGEELFDHGGFSHGFSLYREMLHVPLYIKLPGQTEGKSSTSEVNLVDLYPTVAEILGIELEHAVDGRSIWPLIREPDSPQASDRAGLAQVAWRNRCVGRSIAAGRFKLIEISSNYEGLRDQLRLYDRHRDPGETTDLSESHPEIARELHAQLKQQFAFHQELAVAEPENRLEKLDQKRLRALGYIQ
jgi:arylsulfatase A-like enzyme